MNLDDISRFPAWGIYVLVVITMILRVEGYRQAIRRRPWLWREYLWSAWGFHLGLLAAILVAIVAFAFPVHWISLPHRDQLMLIVCLAVCWYLNYRFLRELVAPTKPPNNQ